MVQTGIVDVVRKLRSVWPRDVSFSFCFHSFIVIRTGFSISLGKDHKSVPRQREQDTSSLMDWGLCHRTCYELVNGGLLCCDCRD